MVYKWKEEWKLAKMFIHQFTSVSILKILNYSSVREDEKSQMS